MKRYQLSFSNIDIGGTLMIKEEIRICEVPEEIMAQIQEKLRPLKISILEKFDKAKDEAFHPYKHPIGCFLDGDSILAAAKECGIKLSLMDPIFEDISAVFAFRNLPIEDAKKIYEIYERRYDETFSSRVLEARHTKREQIIDSIDSCNLDYTRAILRNLDKVYFEHEIDEIIKLIDLMFESVK